MDTLDPGKRTRVDTDDEAAASRTSKRRRLGYGQFTEGLSHDDYTVGWICALHIELAAAEAMLDNVHDSLPRAAGDSNTYTLGNIGQHNIVIASLPTGGYGTNNAAVVANNMDRSFRYLQVRLMVGIGGDVPTEADVRLGDVVVSTKVIQHDMGKTLSKGRFHRTGTLCEPPNAVMTAITKLRANHESRPNEISSIISEISQRNPSMTKYVRQSSLQDLLFDTSYGHVASMDSCNTCDRSKLLERSSRSDDNPKIHYGVIASGNQVMRDAETRDRLGQELNVLCFEMEAAGLMDNFSCLVIRGICDYSDSHKNKEWQEYAAAVAAAYAKELLSVMPLNSTKRSATSPITEQRIRDQRKALLDSLLFKQIDSQHDNIKAAYSETCKWLLQHPGYTNWKDPTNLGQHNGFLWIKGKPGTGKSTLMKFIYSRTKRTSEDEVIAFFFNARGDELEKSTEGMYRSLLVQLLERLPDIQGVLDDPDLVSRFQRPSFAWNTEILCNLLANAIKQLNQRSLTCFIDALDECPEDQVEAMIEIFGDLEQHAGKTGTRLYICFSSRRYPHITIENGLELILEVETGHGKDLERYVQGKLKAGRGKLAQEIKTEILQKAAGVFMWVVLVIGILNKEFRDGRQFAVRKRLAEIPTKLSELFIDILKKDNNNMEYLLLSIQWILYAKRPLKQEEFYFAVVSGLDPEQALIEWDPDNLTKMTMAQFVLSSSKGLAEVTRSKDKTVQFIHESVRDFLVKDNGLDYLIKNNDLGDLEDIPSASHDQLRKCCYKYMQVDISSYVTFDEQLPAASSDTAKELRREVSDKFPFLEYATKNGLYHSDRAAAGLPESAQPRLLSMFDLEFWINLNNLFEKFEVRRLTSTSLLYLLAENNLANLLKTQHNYDLEMLYEQGGRYRYPLFAALINGHQETIKAILQLEQKSSNDEIDARIKYERGFTARQTQLPLLWAASKGHKQLLILLLDRGSEIDQRDKKGQTALSCATRVGQTEIVQLLLNKGANTDLQNNYVESPLHLAIQTQQTEIVQLLLNKGTNIDLQNIESNFSLQLAIQNQRTEIVHLLLNKGANIDLQNIESNFSLQLAIQNQQTEIVQLLLNKGANIDLQNNYGESPLHWAVKIANTKAVQMLLDKGANIGLRDSNNQTPLCIAFAKGRLEIAQLLRQQDA